MLKFEFPADCEFDEDETLNSTSYDPNDNNGTITSHIAKKQRGQIFRDLDLTTNLLQLNRRRKQKIVVLDEDSPCIIEDDNNLIELNKYGYGFKNRHFSILRNLREEACEFLEIGQPEHCSPRERRRLRIESENKAFDAARYLGDYFEGASDPIYTEAMQYRPFWLDMWDRYLELKKQKPALHGSSACPKEAAFESIGGFSDEERDVLSKICPSEEAPPASSSSAVPDKEGDLPAFLTLADVLFGHCYDVRMTQGEPTVESAYCMARLSCSLSWLETWTPSAGESSPRAAILFLLRRSLSVPYLRLWRLVRKVLADLAKLLLLGKRPLLKCLLRVRQVFERTDTHYLLNRLYVDDLCGWVQRLEAQQLQGLAVDFNRAKTEIETGSATSGRELLGFHLPQLEQWAEGEAERERVRKRDRDRLGQGDGEGEPAAIPQELLDYSRLQYEDAEAFSYLSVGGGDADPSEGAAGGELPVRVRDMLTVVKKPEEAAASSRRGPLIEEISNDTSIDVDPIQNSFESLKL